MARPLSATQAEQAQAMQAMAGQQAGGTAVPTTPQNLTAVNGAQFREIKPEELASNQLQGLLAKDSPLMEMSKTQGKQFAASRGLLNTSIAGEAAQNAMIQNAMPIAIQDAERYGKLYDKNLDIANQFALQKAEFDWQGTENEKDRALQKFLQSSDQGFQLQKLDKEQQFERMLTEYELGWRSGENALDRALQETLSAREIASRQAIASMEISARRDIAGMEIASRENLAQMQIEAETALAEAERLFRQSENELDRALEEYRINQSYENEMKLMQAQQDFQASQSELDRAFQLERDAANYANSLEVANLNIDANRELAEFNADERRTLAEMDIEAADRRQLEDQEFRSSEGQLDREFNQQMEDQRFQNNQILNDQNFQNQLTLEDRRAANALANLNKQTNSAYVMNVISNVTPILADPNLSAGEKKNAMADVIDLANAFATAGGIEIEPIDPDELFGAPVYSGLPNY